MTLPAYRVDSAPLAGAPYRVYTITLADGRVVRSQLSPYGDGEAEQYVRDYLLAVNTPPPPPLTFDRGSGKPKRGDNWKGKPFLKRDDE